MIRTSDAIARVHPSATMAFTARAAELKREGYDIISLSAGEPDFATPPHIRSAAAAAIEAGQTRYTGVDGTVDLKRAVADRFERRLGRATSIEQISISSGGKQIIFNALLATLNVDDEVIIPAPYWVSYPEIVRFAGAWPKIISSDAEKHWRPDLGAIETAITPRTRWLMLCSPCNPTGVVLTTVELQGLAEIMRRHPQLLLMSDDLYADIVFEPGHAPSILQVAPDLEERVLIVDGVSKSWAMTGWRIGFGRGAPELIGLMRKLQSHVTSCPAAPSQAAALAALSGPQDFIAEACRAYRRRRDLVMAALAACPGLSLVRPEGAFYLYIGVAALIGTLSPQGRALNDDVDIARALLEEAGVAMVPGTGFGAAPALRISIAASDQELTQACERISSFCEKVMKNS